MSTNPLREQMIRDASRWYRRHRAGLQNSPPAVVALVAGMGLFAASWILFAAWTAVSALSNAALDALRVADDTALTRTVLDPVHAYLHDNAAGLPVTAGQLWTTWALATVILFCLATVGSRGGRIGWTVMGALTAAMVYAATPAPGGTRAVAAGLAATLWALLSVAAFARTRAADPAVIVQHVTQPQMPPLSARLIDDVDDVAAGETVVALVPRF